MKANLDPSLEIFADVIRNPSFPLSDFKRKQHERIAEIQSEKSEPRLMAMRLLPGLIYGENHAYGNSLTGTGTEQSVETLRQFKHHRVSSRVVQT